MKKLKDESFNRFLIADIWLQYLKLSGQITFRDRDEERMWLALNQNTLPSVLPNKKRQRIPNNYLRSKKLTELCEEYLGKINPLTGKRYTYKDIGVMWDPDFVDSSLVAGDKTSGLEEDVLWEDTHGLFKDRGGPYFQSQDRDYSEESDKANRRWYKKYANLTKDKKCQPLSGEQAKNIVLRHKRYLLSLAP